MVGVIGYPSAWNCTALACWSIAFFGRRSSANLRIASALGADLACFDAARISRPPGTWNHKHRPPTRVATLHLERDRTFVADRVLRDVPVVSDDGSRVGGDRKPSAPRATTRCCRSSRRSTSPTSSGVRRVATTRSRARSTRTRARASTSSRRRSAAGAASRAGAADRSTTSPPALWGMTPRGREFIELRERLAERFAGEIARTAARYGLERR